MSASLAVRLHELTEKSKQVIAERKAKALLEREKRAAAKDVEARGQAKAMLGSVERKAWKAASRGFNEVCVTPKIGEQYLYKNSLGKDRLGKTELYWKFFYLWEFCRELGLQPSVRYNHDGVGQRNWYEFWVQW